MESNNNLNAEMALAEIRLASPDLADFVIWASQLGDDNEESHEASQFVTVVNYAYSYARNKNQESAEETSAEADGEE